MVWYSGACDTGFPRSQRFSIFQDLDLCFKIWIPNFIRIQVAEVQILNEKAFSAGVCVNSLQDIIIGFDDGTLNDGVFFKIPA